VLFLLARKSASGMSLLAADTGHLQGMRSIDGLISALSKIASAPSSRAGYEELARCYREGGMEEEADSVYFLISEKFRVDSASSDSERRGHDTSLP
jgi:hypothetical protein